MATIKAFAIVHDNVMSRLLDVVQVLDGGQLVGGYSWVGKVGVWNALIVVTTAAVLDAIEAAEPTNALVLARMTNGRTQLNTNISAGVRTRLNTWLTARGQSTEAVAPIGQIIRRVFRRVNAAFDESVMDVN